jgi:Metal binding domain of Ada
MVENLARETTGAKTYTLLGSDRRPYTSTVKGILGGHKWDRVYGRLDCAVAARAIAEGGYVSQRVFFADEPTAIAAGYRPCAICLPRQYAGWKEERVNAGSARRWFVPVAERG